MVALKTEHTIMSYTVTSSENAYGEVQAEESKFPTKNQEPPKPNVVTEKQLVNQPIVSVLNSEMMGEEPLRKRIPNNENKLPPLLTMFLRGKPTC